VPGLQDFSTRPVRCRRVRSIRSVSALLCARAAKYPGIANHPRRTWNRGCRVWRQRG